MKKSKNVLNFVVKIWQNFVLVLGRYVILLPVMRCGFTIGRLVASQSTPAELVKMNQQQLLFVQVNLNENIYFVYSLTQMILFLSMLLMKTRQ